MLNSVVSDHSLCFYWCFHDGLLLWLVVFSAVVLLLFEFTLYTYLGGFALVCDCWCVADFWLLCCWLLYVAGLVVAFGLKCWLVMFIC